MSYIATVSDSLALCRHGGVTSNSPLINLGLKDWNVHFSALIAGNPLSKSPSNRTQHLLHSTVESRTDTEAEHLGHIQSNLCLFRLWRLHSFTSSSCQLESHSCVLMQPCMVLHHTIQLPQWIPSHFHGIVAMTLHSRVPTSELRCICMLNTKHTASNPKEKYIILIF